MEEEMVNKIKEEMEGKVDNSKDKTLD